VDWLLAEFGPTEKAWIASMDRNQELMAVRYACLAALLTLPGILAFRKGSRGDARALAGLLADLRAAAVAGLAVLQVPAACQAPPLPTRPQSPSVQEGTAGLADLHLDQQREAERARAQSLIEMEAVQTIRERPFVSQLPVLGGLIVTIRELWNSIATKWYVRPIIQQQTDFNTRVVSHLHIVQDQLDRMAELGQTAEQQGAMIAWLSRRADQLEEWSAGQEQLLSGQVRDLAENIRELTALAEQIARAENPAEGVQH
jgi:hypothetical protein